MEEMNNNEVQNIEPTNNGGVKVLLVILIVIGLIIIGLLSYKMFVQDKKDDRKETEKVDEDVISKVLDEKIKENVIKFPYVSMVRYNISYDELYKTRIAYLAIDSLKIEAAPGLPEVTIKGDMVRSAAKKLYNYELTYDKDTDIPLNKLAFNGESNIYAKYNKAKDEYSIGKQGVTGSVLNVKTILDAKYNNGIYTATFVDGIYNYVGSSDTDCNVIDKSGNKMSMKCFATEVGSSEMLNSMANEYAISHKDELPQYEISFKIDGDNYSFDNIKKIN